MSTVMDESMYWQYDPAELILRDHLAIDRTALANERTFLAYVRTALALLVIGVTFTHFLNQWFFLVIGGCLDVSGVILLLVGSVHFVRTRRLILSIQSISKNHSP